MSTIPKTKPTPAGADSGTGAPEPAPNPWEIWTNRNLLLLWIGQFISSLGDWALWIAAPICVYQQTGNRVDLAFVLVTEGLPLLFVAPIAGVLVDRWDRRRTMVTVDVLRGAMLCLLVLPVTPQALRAFAGGLHAHPQHLVLPISPPLWSYYAVVFVNSGLSAFFSPARTAILTQIVPRRQLMRTNAMLGAAIQFCEFIGPIFGGLIITLLLKRGAFICDAVSFAISAICIALVTGVTPLVRGTYAAGVAGVVEDLKAGMAFIQRTPVVRGLVMMGPLIYVVTTVLNAPEYAFAKDYLHASKMDYSILISAAGVGVVVGSVAVISWLHRFQPLTLLLAGLLLAAAGGVGYGLSPNYLWALVPHFFLGLGGVLASIPILTLIQTYVPSDILGRVSGSWSIYTRAAQILSGISAGFLAANMSIRYLYVADSLLFLVLAVMAIVLLRPALREPELISPTPTPQAATDPQ